MKPQQANLPSNSLARKKPTPLTISIFFSFLVIGHFGFTLPIKGDLAALDLQAKFPKSTKQIVLVHAPSWDSNFGILERYSRSGNSWKEEGRPISVSLGAKGMAWGVGLQKNQGPGPRKVEGDKRTPAGVFRLGPAFGYSETKPDGVSLPYRQATEYSYFVDDPNSSFYNHWVERRDGSQPPWKSAERMRRKDHLYYLGLVVQQNTKPVIKGRGSAVFLPGCCKSLARLDIQAACSRACL
jgi:L,D-peptidoglycan transpeptidase YkuD (ErfK/YbiS/YcfS/YnhG family)